MSPSPTSAVVVPKCGLDNPASANNCFLNSVLQAFYNIESCREFLLNPSAAHQSDDLISKISQLFVHLFFDGQGSSISPTSVRLSLSEQFKTAGRFRLDEMEDAVEAFETILLHIHGGDVDQPCSKLPCLGHNVFAFESIESTRCLSPACGKIAMVPKTREFLLRVNTQELYQLVADNLQPPLDLASALGKLGKLVGCFCTHKPKTKLTCRVWHTFFLNK